MTSFVACAACSWRSSLVAWSSMARLRTLALAGLLGMVYVLLWK